MAIGTASTATAEHSVALGVGSVADRANTVSVGAEGAERQITNVAAGTGDSDAVNMAQLTETNDRVGVVEDQVTGLDGRVGDVEEVAAMAVAYDDDSRGTVTFDGADGTLLTNLAEGDVSADSTDAVTGSQLFETNERVGVVEDQVTDLDGRIGDVEGVAANAITYDDDSRASATLAGADGTVLTNLAAGQVNATSTDAVTGAQLYGSMNSVATAFGGNTVVDANGRLIGTVYSVQGSYYGNVGEALGAIDTHIGLLDERLAGVEGLVAEGQANNRRVAVGGGNDAALVNPDSDAIAVGSGAQAGGRNALAIGDGAYAHGDNDIAIGSGAHVGADGSTAVGANATITADATNAVAVGEGTSVSAASGTAVGQGASVTAEGAVALGQGSVADRANTVSVGSAGSERQIANVAAGTADTDAANVGQVNAATAQSRSYTDTVATQTLSSANAYTDQQFAVWNDNFDAFRGDVERRFHEVDRRMDRQGAMGAAMLNMATSAAGVRTQNRVGVGVGFQGGESALSVGYQRAISERATITFGGAFSGDEKSVGVGAGFGW